MTKINLYWNKNMKLQINLNSMVKISSKLHKKWLQDIFLKQCCFIWNNIGIFQGKKGLIFVHITYYFFTSIIVTKHRTRIVNTCTMLEGNSMHSPIRHISMLFIVVHRIRQCAELPIMTVHVFWTSTNTNTSSWKG